MKQYIEALLVERAGYVQRGLTHRVKAVDEALRDAGYESKGSVQKEIETATIEPVMERAVRKAAPKRKG